MFVFRLIHKKEEIKIILTYIAENLAERENTGNWNIKFNWKLIKNIF